MARRTAILVLLLLPLTAFAGSFVSSIQVIPPNPGAFEPYMVHISGDMPDGCWSLGQVGLSSFELVDISGPGISCITVLVPFTAEFQRSGSQAGHYMLIFTEMHDSLNHPGSWQHVVEFDIGEPGVPADDRTWSTVKALYR